MKKFVMAAILSAAMFFLTSLPAAAAAKNTFKFGMWFGVGTEFDAQNKQIITDVVTAFSQKSKYDIEFVWFSNYDEFVDSAKKGAIDFIYAFKYEVIYELFAGDRYDPFLMPYLMDSKGISMCLYANVDGDIKKTSDLKGRRILVTSGFPEYCGLRKLLPGKPEDIFGTIETSVSGMSSIYSLAMNDADVIYISDFSEKFMKMNNPGPTKKITPLLCTDKYPLMPIMASRDIPEELLVEFRKAFSNVTKEESLKKYRPLFTTYKFKVLPVNRKDYEPIVDVFREAKEKGWNRDYEVWTKMVKKREK